VNFSIGHNVQKLEDLRSPYVAGLVSLKVTMGFKFHKLVVPFQIHTHTIYSRKAGGYRRTFAHQSWQL